MKFFTKTLLSGSTSFCIISGTFSPVGFVLFVYGLFLIYQSLLMASQEKQVYSFLPVKRD